MLFVQKSFTCGRNIIRMYGLCSARVVEQDRMKLSSETKIIARGIPCLVGKITEKTQ